MGILFDQETERLVLCRGIKYGIVHIPLDECTKCEHHKTFYESKPAQNDKPPIEIVVCGLPASIRVVYQVKGVSNKGRTPIKEEKR